jgi:hypothetical protein
MLQARAAAMVLNLNCALILLPVCRNLMNAARGAFESKRSLRRLFDKNILFHKWCAYTICFFVAVHILAHFYNINSLANPKEIYLNEALEVTADLDHREKACVSARPPPRSSRPLPTHTRARLLGSQQGFSGLLHARFFWPTTRPARLRSSVTHALGRGMLLARERPYVLSARGTSAKGRGWM